MADNEDVLAQARRRFDEGMLADLDNRNEADEDLRFAAGEQWPAEMLRDRQKEGRPSLTINRMPQFLRQIVGDIRQNKPSIKVRAAGGAADVDLAEKLTGLCRHIQVQSDADTAYITAIESAARCGMGSWRVLTQYSSDDTFEQDIRIKRITDPFAVVWDPNAEEWDKSDARWCFVKQDMPLEDFKETYPDAAIGDWESAQPALEGRTRDTTQWWTAEKVTVAEYWRKVPERVKLYLLGDGTVVDELPDGLPVQVMSEREVDRFKIEQYVVNGAEILEGPNEWPGRIIPIVSVTGEEVHIGKRTVRHGMVRFAKDAQRVFNYMRSAGVETVALQPKAPFIATAEQVKGYEDMWRTAGRRNYATLIYNADPNAPGAPQRSIPPQPSQGFLAEIGVAAEDMKATTGIYDAALGNRSNETSGRAIVARQREADVGTFVYVDNLARAIRHCGSIIVDLIPKIYDTERVVRILDEDGEEDQVVLNQQMADGFDADGLTVYKMLNDVSVGEYDVTVDVGPSYTTKRIEAADSMMAFMQAVPGSAQFVADLFAKSMDWPGAEKIAKRLEKMLPPGLDEDGPMQQPPPDPEKMAKAEKAKAEAEKILAEIIAGQADVEKTEADAQSVRLGNIEKSLNIEALMGQIDTAVEAAIAQRLPQIIGNVLSGAQPPAAPPMAPNPGPAPAQMPPNGGVPPGI